MVPIIVAAAVVVVAVIISILWISFRRVPGPNEALLVTGGRGKGGQDFRIVVGKPTTVIPGIQLVRSLRLNLHEIPLELREATTKQGIPVGVRAAAAFRVGTDPTSIETAARQFVGSEQAMDNQVEQILLGHLRDYLGNLTMEELIPGKEKLAKEVLEVSGQEMANMGLTLQTMKVQEIIDPSGYIKNLAAPHIAEAERLARIARADNDRQAAEAEQIRAQKVAAAERDTQIKTAQYSAEVQAEQATASQSGPLADAKAQAAVVTQRTEIAKLKAEQTERELDSQVRKPAEAQRDAQIAQAEAQRQTTILAAQAEAEHTRQLATAQSEQIKLMADAQATQTRSVGQAEADATRAKGEAEGSALHARAEALKENQDAVIGQQVAGQLPEIVRAVASAFDGAQMTILNGAEGVTGSFINVLATALQAKDVVLDAVANGNENRHRNGHVPEVPAEVTGVH